MKRTLHTTPQAPVTAKDIVRFYNDSYINNEASIDLTECVLAGDNGDVEIELTTDGSKNEMRIALACMHAPIEHKQLIKTYYEIAQCVQATHIKLLSTGSCEFWNEENYFVWSIQEIRFNDIVNEQRKKKQEECERLMGHIKRTAFRFVIDEHSDEDLQVFEEYIKELLEVLQHAGSQETLQKDCVEELLSYNDSIIAFKAYPYVSDLRIKEKLLRCMIEHNDFGCIYELLVERKIQEEVLMEQIVSVLKGNKKSPYRNKSIHELPTELSDVVSKFWK